MNFSKKSLVVLFVMSILILIPVFSYAMVTEPIEPILLTQADFDEAYELDGFDTEKGIWYSSSSWTYYMPAGNFTMSGDIDLSDSDGDADFLEFTSGECVVDLNGSTVEAILYVQSDDQPVSLTLNGDGAIIGDVACYGNASVIINGGTYEGTFWSQYGATLTINDCKLAYFPSDYEEGDFQSAGIMVSDDASLIVNGGTFLSSVFSVIYADDLFDTGATLIEINGGTFKGSECAAVIQNCDEITISSGEFIGEGMAALDAEEFSTLTITGGTFEGPMAGLSVFNATDTISLSGGTFTSTEGTKGYGGVDVQSGIVLLTTKEDGGEDAFASALVDGCMYSPTISIDTSEVYSQPYFWAYTDQPTISVVELTATTPIEKIELTIGSDDVFVGETPATELTVAVYPEGAYSSDTIGVTWRECDDNTGGSRFNMDPEVFEEGKWYLAMPRFEDEDENSVFNEGYVVTDDTKIYINGTLIEDPSNLFPYLIQAQTPPLIELATITIEPPLVGTKITSEKSDFAGEIQKPQPIISVDEDANYFIPATMTVAANWVTSTDQDSYWYLGEVTASGDYYAGFVLIANKGYYFSRSTEVLVNDEPATVFYLMGDDEEETSYCTSMYVIHDMKAEEGVTVYFESNGGTTVDPQTVLKGKTVEEPIDPSKSGYKFVAWCSDKELKNKFDFKAAINEDTYLYAKYEKKSSGSSSSGGSSTSSYKITTKSDNENVEITPKNPSVKKNASQEFSFKANDGYEITDVLVDGKSVGAVSKYILEKVTAKHTIEVKTQKITSLSYVDDWAKDEMTKAEDKGLIPETFKNKDASKEVSRTDFCAVSVKLYEALTGKKAEKPANNPFTDTNDDYVLKAYALGITKGVSESSFGNGTITREQMSTMIDRALNKAGIDTTIDLEKVAKFADDDEIHDWAKSSVYSMSEKGIVKGVGDNKFDPLGLAKIEEALAISVRCVEEFTK